MQKKRISEICETSDHMEANSLLQKNWSLYDTATRDGKIIYILVRKESADSPKDE